MLIFYCSSRRFLLATRGHNKKWGEEASWKNLPTPLIFSFRKKKKNVKLARWRCNFQVQQTKETCDGKSCLKWIFWAKQKSFFFAIRCMSLQKCYKQKKLLRKKKKENIGMWVSKQWWIFFKRQRQQQACFAHRTRERETVLQLEKNIYRVDRNCATASLLITAAAWSQSRSSLMPNAFWLCNFKTFK